MDGDELKNSVNLLKGYSWKVNNDGVFMYKDGVIIDKQKTGFELGNHIAYFFPEDQQVLILTDYKLKTLKNEFYPAQLIPQRFNNGLWFKGVHGAIVINSKGAQLKAEIFNYIPNSNDALYKVASETTNILLKNYRNITLNTVTSIDFYNPEPTITNTTNAVVNSNSNVSGFQKEINACNGSGKCLAEKITDKYTALKKSGMAEETVFQQLAQDFIAVGAHNAKALFDMIFALNNSVLPKEKYAKILDKMSKEQRANLRAYSQKITDDYTKNHKMN